MRLSSALRDRLVLDQLQIDEPRRQQAEGGDHRDRGEADAKMELVQLALVVAQFAEVAHDRQLIWR